MYRYFKVIVNKVIYERYTNKKCQLVINYCPVYIIYYYNLLASRVGKIGSSIY